MNGSNPLQDPPALHDPAQLTQRLTGLIERGGPIPLGLFMAYANAHYYATRDPLGVDGDFTTAPEISQMFGEMLGLWCADVLMRADVDGPVAVVELGPGRGTLMADALRAMARFDCRPDVHFVETSPVLRDLQAATVPMARFHADATSLPDDRPLLIIANEFFDALPIRQLVRTADGWREAMVGIANGRFARMPGAAPMDAALPAEWRDLPPGTIVESSPASAAIAGDIARRLAAQGGAMLTIDYGHAHTAPGDTLQAVAGHAYADPFDAPGERDLTAHVDFAMLAQVGQTAGLRVAGPVEQGHFLQALGIGARADALMAKRPDRAAALAAERDRLTAPDQMGSLFKALAMVAPRWPDPAGFAL